MENYHFFLGGNDLEMEAIRRLLNERGVPAKRIHDKQLGWGAKVSNYREELGKLPPEATAVLIELENDWERKGGKVLVVDHHGGRAGIDRPTSLEQVWRLLEVPPGEWGRGKFRDFPLIAANDRGYIPAMRRLGASDKEISDIRARDRAAQGITVEQEQQAEAALALKRITQGGGLTVVDLPHARTATVTDRLLLNGGYRNLLVLSPDEINFFGEGGLVCRLHEKWPGGWYGGELPRQGFWGHASQGLDPRAVEEELAQALAQRSAGE